MGPLEVGPGQGLQIQEVGSPERLMVTSSNCNQSEASGLGYPELNRFHWSLVIWRHPETQLHIQMRQPLDLRMLGAGE